MEEVYNIRKRLSWDEMYQLLTKYYNNYNTINVPVNFRTRDGINYDETGKNLYSWLINQKAKYSKHKLTGEQINKLITIGLIEEISLEEKQWNEMYILASNYYIFYNNLNVPKNFKTSCGICYDSNGEELGEWLLLQERLYKSNDLKVQYIEKLKKIGMVFDKISVNCDWDSFYKLLKVYIEFYGDYNISISFKTINGYQYDDDGLNLGEWFNEQMQLMKNNEINYVYKAKLELLGIKINKNKDEKWMHMYNEAKMFFHNMGHLNISPALVKIIKEHDYENLLKWIRDQRALYQSNKLKFEKVNYLNQIKMIWEPRKNEFIIKLFCIDNNIPYNEYGGLLKNLPHKEVYYKYNFLCANNIPLIINGVLHEIFLMRDDDLLDKYGISIQELRERYNEEEKIKINVL